MLDSSLPTNSSNLLILDDDMALRLRLSRSLEKRGFTVFPAESLRQARVLLHHQPLEYALLDMKLEDGTSLDFVKELKACNPEIRIVILTGYGNIATAVSAIKHGAVDYIPKPADLTTIEQALRYGNANNPPVVPENPMSPDRVKWEHIQRILASCNNNVSETARRLQMHRRTLQRILAKHAPC